MPDLRNIDSTQELREEIIEIQPELLDITEEISSYTTPNESDKSKSLTQRTMELVEFQNQINIFFDLYHQNQDSEGKSLLAALNFYLSKLHENEILGQNKEIIRNNRELRFKTILAFYIKLREKRIQGNEDFIEIVESTIEKYKDLTAIEAQILLFIVKRSTKNSVTTSENSKEKTDLKKKEILKIFNNANLDLSDLLDFVNNEDISVEQALYVIEKSAGKYGNNQEIVSNILERNTTNPNILLLRNNLISKNREIAYSILSKKIETIKRNGIGCYGVLIQELTSRSNLYNDEVVSLITQLIPIIIKSNNNGLKSNLLDKIPDLIKKPLSVKTKSDLLLALYQNKNLLRETDLDKIKELAETIINELVTDQATPVDKKIKSLLILIKIVPEINKDKINKSVYTFLSELVEENYTLESKIENLKKLKAKNLLDEDGPYAYKQIIKKIIKKQIEDLRNSENPDGYYLIDDLRRMSRERIFVSTDYDDELRKEVFSLVRVGNGIGDSFTQFCRIFKPTIDDVIYEIKKPEEIPNDKEVKSKTEICMLFLNYLKNSIDAHIRYEEDYENEIDTICDFLENEEIKELFSKDKNPEKLLNFIKELSTSLPKPGVEQAQANRRFDQQNQSFNQGFMGNIDSVNYDKYAPRLKKYPRIIKIQKEFEKLSKYEKKPRAVVIGGVTGINLFKGKKRDGKQ